MNSIDSLDRLIGETLYTLSSDASRIIKHLDDLSKEDLERISNLAWELYTASTIKKYEDE